MDKATRKLTLCFASLFEECEEKSINSHSIAQTNLRLLAEKGHLVTFKSQDLFKVIKTKTSIKDSHGFAKVGLKAVSSFPGFCKSHDANLFKSIDSPSLKLSENSIELLVFRTFVHEAYKKLCSHHKTDSYSIINPTGEAERLQTVEGFQLGYIDLIVQAQKLYQNITSGESCYKYVEIEFSEMLPFCFISPINFEIKPSFGGKDPREYTTYDSCLIGLIPTISGSKFILAFPRSQQKNIQIFLRRLGSQKRLMPTQVLQVALESSENLYFQPSWIKSISEDHRELLGKAFHRDLTVTDVLGKSFLPEGFLNYSGNVFAKSNTLITRKWKAKLS